MCYKLILFLGTIYFCVGRKHPKIVLNGYEFRMRPIPDSLNKTLWICTQEPKTKCKVRLQSSGNQLFVKNVAHNHVPSFKGNLSELKSQTVYINYTNERFSF